MMLLDNLITNAHKYSPPGEQIEVNLRANDGGEVEVTVRDHGIGIDEAALPELFTPFYRAYSAKQFAPGMGLGLAVCKRIVDAHGGRTWAHSRPEGGSDFSFALPAIEP